MKWCVVVEFKNGEKRFLRGLDIEDVLELLEKHDIKYLRMELC